MCEFRYEPNVWIVISFTNPNGCQFFETVADKMSIVKLICIAHIYNAYNTPESKWNTREDSFHLSISICAIFAFAMAVM